jgi:DNA-binding beta-propeller fold protein YncE
MTITKFTLSHLAALLFSLSSMVASSAATTYPLNSPQGLALDFKGNLYVANNSGNQVLVYDTSYQQVSSKTITHDVVNPNGLAFDPSGNLWVVNAGNSSIVEYSPAGVVESDFYTYNGGVPYAIAVDAIGDVWVETDYATVMVYPQGSVIPQASFSNPTDAFTGIATYQGIAVIGTNTQRQIWPIAPTLALLFRSSPLSETGFAMAFDTAGNLYSGNIDNTLSVYSIMGTKMLVKLGFFPFGLAVDSTRGRIYVADANHNRIVVYSTSGTLLHTIN